MLTRRVGPERQVRGLIERARELGIRGAEQCRRARGIDRPDDRARAVGERQERQRAVLHEALPGGELMRLGGGDVGDDRELLVRAARRGEARGLAHPRVRPVRPHHELRRQLPLRRAQAHAVRADRERLERGVRDAPAGGAEGLEQRALQQAVLEDVAEVRLPDVGGVEHQHRGTRGRDALVPDAHALVGAHARSGAHRPRARGAEQPLAGARQRDDPRVQRCVRLEGGRRMRLEQRHLEAAALQQRRGTRPHRTAADHRDLSHGAPAGRAPGAGWDRRSRR